MSSGPLFSSDGFHYSVSFYDDKCTLTSAYSFLCVLQHGSSAILELDLEHYVIPAPANPGQVYAANNAENPRFSVADGSGNSSYSYKDGSVSTDRPATGKVIC